LPSKRLNYKKAAILYDLTEDYSVGLSEAFQENFKELGGEIVCIESFKSGDEGLQGAAHQDKGV
jgi:amino acid/amide ABC transporter substrate-binding protein, HAAT family (TC 3.A.1.4.-)